MSHFPKQKCNNGLHFQKTASRGTEEKRASFKNKRETAELKANGAWLFQVWKKTLSRLSRSCEESELTIAGSTETECRRSQFRSRVKHSYLLRKRKTLQTSQTYWWSRCARFLPVLHRRSIGVQSLWVSRRICCPRRSWLTSAFRGTARSSCGWSLVPVMKATRSYTHKCGYPAGSMVCGILWERFVRSIFNFSWNVNYPCVRKCQHLKPPNSYNSPEKQSGKYPATKETQCSKIWCILQAIKVPSWFILFFPVTKIFKASGFGHRQRQATTQFQRNTRQDHICFARRWVWLQNSWPKELLFFCLWIVTTIVHVLCIPRSWCGTRGYWGNFLATKAAFVCFPIGHPFIPDLSHPSTPCVSCCVRSCGAEHIVMHATRQGGHRVCFM